MYGGCLWRSIYIIGTRHINPQDTTSSLAKWRHSITLMACLPHCLSLNLIYYTVNENCTTLLLHRYTLRKAQARGLNMVCFNWTDHPKRFILFVCNQETHARYFSNYDKKKRREEKKKSYMNPWGQLQWRPIKRIIF